MFEIMQNSVTNNTEYTSSKIKYPKYNSFVAIDFETATSSCCSACAIGLVKVVDKQIVDTYYTLIQPPYNKYDAATINIHHITPEQTANADTFPVVWEKIKHFFNDTYLVAHNTKFDMSVLKALFDYNNIEDIDFPYFDSIPFSTYKIPSGSGIARSLDARCKFFGIALDEHHNALSDAKACAELVLYVLKNSRYKTISTCLSAHAYKLRYLKDVESKKSFEWMQRRTIKIDEVAATIDESEKVIDCDFYGKSFCFTGELKALTREDAYAKVIAGGGIVKSNVTKKVDYLVNADTAMTRKLKDALALQAKGYHIKILSDEGFMDMINNGR